MSVYSKIGTALFVAEKLKTAVEAYEIAVATSDPATREQAMFAAATQLAEAAAIGVPLSILDQIVTKTGLDRVFDSLSKDVTFQQYLRDQVTARNIRDFSLGQLGEFGLHQLRDWVIANQYLDPIFSLVNTATTSALNWVPPRRDPLVLDLDGGGITTSGINPNAPILFDQDGDGTLTATGWIGAGEAIVVRDLNANGRVDSGRELFGDSTILTRGPNAGQLAVNGFQALADLDANASGAADGKFDSSDVAFAGVRLWKDLNQDGVSQSGELFTFAQLGVQSINVNGSVSNVDLGGGNTQTFSGSFTRTNGQTGNSGTAELAGSLLLANNNFYREFTDDPEITPAAYALPSMAGSGAVRDLQPAMSLGNAQALDLQAKLALFAADTTRDQQLAHLDDLILSWGATNAMRASNLQARDEYSTDVRCNVPAICCVELC